MIAGSAISLAVAGAVYQGTKCAVISSRHKDDVYAAMTAGCAAGSTAALKTRSMKVAFGACGALASVAAMVKLAGEIRPEEQAVTHFFPLSFGVVGFSREGSGTDHL